MRANGEFSVALVDAVRPRAGAVPSPRYLVLDVSGGSNARDPMRRCGAGTERAVVWLAVNRGAQVTDSQAVLVESCWETLDADVDTMTLVRDSLIVPFWVAATDSTLVVRYSRRAPERGLLVQPAPPKMRSP